MSYSGVVKLRTAEAKPKLPTVCCASKRNRATGCTGGNHSNARDPSGGASYETPNGRKTKPNTVTSKPKAITCSGKDQRAQKKHDTSPNATQSYGAFTVIPPNPKKRDELQKRAEVELAALENFKHNQKVRHVSFVPSAVGGTLTLEEVRRKQEEQMKTCKKLHHLRPETRN